MHVAPTLGAPRDVLDYVSATGSSEYLPRYGIHALHEAKKLPATAAALSPKRRQTTPTVGRRHHLPALGVILRMWSELRRGFGYDEQKEKGSKSCSHGLGLALLRGALPSAMFRDAHNDNALLLLASTFQHPSSTSSIKVNGQAPLADISWNPEERHNNNNISRGRVSPNHRFPTQHRTIRTAPSAISSPPPVLATKKGLQETKKKKATSSHHHNNAAAAAQLQQQHHQQHRRSSLGGQFARGSLVDRLQTHINTISSATEDDAVIGGDDPAVEDHQAVSKEGATISKQRAGTAGNPPSSPPDGQHHRHILQSLKLRGENILEKLTGALATGGA